MDKGLEKLLERLSAINERIEAKEKVDKSDKKVVISIADNATTSCGCVGVKVENCEGADVAIATAALMSSLLERCKPGTEDKVILLVLLLAREIFTHSSSPEEVKRHEDEDMEKLNKLFGDDDEED